MYVKYKKVNKSQANSAPIDPKINRDVLLKQTNQTMIYEVPMTYSFLGKKTHFT